MFDTFCWFSKSLKDHRMIAGENEAVEIVRVFSLVGSGDWIFCLQVASRREQTADSEAKSSIAA